MKTLWKKSVGKQLFKNLKVDQLFILNDDYNHDPTECRVYIKINKNKENNAYSIDGLARKTTVSPSTAVILVYINEVHLETEES